MANKKRKSKGIDQDSDLIDRLTDYDLPELRKGKAGIPEGELMSQKLKGAIAGKKAKKKVGVPAGAIAEAKMRAAKKRKSVGISEQAVMREKLKSAQAKGRKKASKASKKGIDYSKLSNKLVK